MNIISKRYWFFAFSALLIIPGMIAIVVLGLPLSVDFAGGSMLDIRFNSGTQPALTDVRAVYRDFGYNEVDVRLSGGDALVVRSLTMDNETAEAVILAMEQRFNDTITVLRFDSVGPLVGREVTSRAAGAVAMASGLILLYIWYAFRNIENAYRFGFAAVLALLHDVAVVFGVQAVFSQLFGWEVDALFLTALLTVIGFSVHDSIVVFDRIRENSTLQRKKPFEEVVNMSILQSMTRSINTQLTVFFTLLALVIFGGDTIRPFMVVMMVGLLSGTYSSLFFASPILVIWENREWKKWFRRESPGTA